MPLAPSGQLLLNVLPILPRNTPPSSDISIPSTMLLRRTFATFSRKMAPIERITLFKIPNDADRDRVLEQYKVLAKTAVKDGKPYILSSAAGASIPDERNQGWNLSVKTTFASLEDMVYYDEQCEAHKALKAVVGPVRTDKLTTFFESVL
ncbi:hypothetical protein CBS63078_6893 [Aspergillus niger]|nr:hypothetical protein CBS63078_6893 [Aspergillus niger]KAI2919167.1 hypothetical protein CBS147371_3872 [Aspergillus niger]KAI2985328.1 hypothetical protein CBS147344_6313 [Aspergillus niger]KAI3001040.1 hypothetical protein CBS147482_6957 [Aspergillus niger]KAI3062289.1 hypothetical protein CBS147343_8829 [Aspergillus niger]